MTWLIAKKWYLMKVFFSMNAKDYKDISRMKMLKSILLEKLSQDDGVNDSVKKILYDKIEKTIKQKVNKFSYDEIEEIYNTILNN